MAMVMVLNNINTAPSAGPSTSHHRSRTPAAMKIARMLQPAAHQRFGTIFRKVAPLSAMMRGTSRESLRTSTKSLASTATSVPAPMATPRRQLSMIV